MSSTTFNTRIQLKYDTYANWEEKNPLLLAGEIAVVVIPADSGKVAQEPAILMKVGDGTKRFKELAFTAALAGDVYEWAKQDKKPTYTAKEISGLEAYIGEKIQDTNTQYKIEADETNSRKFTLYSQEKGADAWTAVSSYEVPAESVYALSAADKSVEVSARAEDGNNASQTVKVNISAGEGNVLSLADDGLMVKVPDAAEYTLAKDENSGDYAAIYHLKKNGEDIGAPINIPKDMVVSSGSVETNPSGQAEGTYLKLVLANAESSEIFIPVESLIEYVTSGSAEGDMVFVSVDPTTHKVTATITDGTVTKAKLAEDVTAELAKIDTHTHAFSALTQEQGDVVIFNCGTADCGEESDNA